jgi:hypothetical protein
VTFPAYDAQTSLHITVSPSLRFVDSLIPACSRRAHPAARSPSPRRFPFCSRLPRLPSRRPGLHVWLLPGLSVSSLASRVLRERCRSGGTRLGGSDPCYAPAEARPRTARFRAQPASRTCLPSCSTSVTPRPTLFPALARAWSPRRPPKLSSRWLRATLLAPLHTQHAVPCPARAADRC